MSFILSKPLDDRDIAQASYTSSRSSLSLIVDAYGSSSITPSLTALLMVSFMVPSSRMIY